MVCYKIKIINYIAPRQSLKTTNAFNLTLSDKENSLLITNNQFDVNLFRNRINVVSRNNFEEYSRGRRFKKLIIDDYLNSGIKGLKNNVLELCYYLGVEEITTYSTPTCYEYNRNIINNIKYIKEIDKGYDEYLELFGEIYFDTYMFYRQSLLTENNSEIIDYFHKDFKYIINPTTVHTSIQTKYLID